MKALNQKTFQEIGVSGVDECLSRFLSQFKAAVHLVPNETKISL